MLKKVLIANRGEIALRILRTCMEMGLETVLIYSATDSEQSYLRLADEAYCIGPADASKSYLNADLIIDLAQKTQCDCIHPGYGFLSENVEFALSCEQCGIKLIGPSSQTIGRMGDKFNARQLMIDNGILVVPGSVCEITLDNIDTIADEIGYPLLIKASAGGGGRGMRKVFHREDLKRLFIEAKTESKQCFGDDRIYLERLILNPRHIEFQILADTHGNIVHLGERDCSIQRRNQKLIEETPSPGITDKLRSKMGDVAIKAARTANYEGAGTIEFVLDQENKYYFIEMNTRLQVEHPITEMVYGLDLVREQIRIASGESLGLTQEALIPRGHALECRINAEDSEHNFRPSSGRVKDLVFPAGIGIRVDSALTNNSEVSPYYDSLIAKVIAFGENREITIKRMQRALKELEINGIQTTKEMLVQIIGSDSFLSGEYDTGYMNEYKGLTIQNGIGIN